MNNILVLPAASRPSINSRISLLPKILAIILEMDAPISARVFDAARAECEDSSDLLTPCRGKRLVGAVNLMGRRRRQRVVSCRVVSCREMSEG